MCERCGKLRTPRRTPLRSAGGTRVKDIRHPRAACLLGLKEKCSVSGCGSNEISSGAETNLLGKQEVPFSGYSSLAETRRGRNYRNGLFRSRRIRRRNSSIDICTQGSRCHVWDTFERGQRRCSRHRRARTGRNRNSSPRRIAPRRRSKPVGKDWQ